MTEFESVIGLEIHAQLSTKTKLFCSCDNDSFDKEPNTNVCPICMGFPGMLPVTNKEALKKAVVASLALACKITRDSKFDRKNYFYPDLPNGFQISQYDQPVGVGGSINIIIDGKTRAIRITRLHLENDAGKLSHEKSGTLLDFNRAGTPLAEIVSEPDIRSAQEARIYAETMHKLLRYSGSSDVDMEKGMMRFDASISIRPMGDAKLYPRAEIKNLNSFRSLEAALNYEIQRQIDLWKKGEPPTGETTVAWDDEKQMTRLLRDKESAADYRYFPEPDLPPLNITDALIDECRASVPESPTEKYLRMMKDYSLSDADAKFYTEDLILADYYEAVAKSCGNPATANSFVLSILLTKIREMGLKIDECKVAPKQLSDLIKAVDKGLISNNAAKSDVLNAMLESGESAEKVISKLGLSQVSDTSEIEKLCKEALAANPKIVADIKAGQTKAMGALVGAVMKLSKGKANPKIVNDILPKLLV